MKKRIKDDEIWQADSNEAGLRTDMVAALRASNKFSEWIFHRVYKETQEYNFIPDPHVEQFLKNSIIDIDLKFRGQTNYRFGIELKNGTADVEREQLERHLVGLKIMQEKRKVLTRFASSEDRILRLVVITGSSKEPISVSELKSLNGFNDKIVWISWHNVVDAIENLPDNEKDNPNIRPLIDNLGNIGFKSRKSNFTKFHSLEKVSKLFEKIPPISEKINKELEILDTILHRIDFEMNNLGYSVSKSMKIIKLPRAKFEKKLNNFLPSKLNSKMERSSLNRWIGRLYVPKEEIENLGVFNESKSINFGVAIGYDIEKRDWFCHIESKSKEQPNENIYSNKKLKSNERIPCNTRNGRAWKLKGKQLNPIRISKFLVSVWENYTNEK